MVCTKTLYNEVRAGNLSLNILKLPEAIKRKKHRKSPEKRKKVYGTSIDERPEIVDSRTEAGHWECDTVVEKPQFWLNLTLQPKLWLRWNSFFYRCVSNLNLQFTTFYEFWYFTKSRQSINSLPISSSPIKLSLLYINIALESLPNICLI